MRNCSTLFERFFRGWGGVEVQSATLGTFFSRWMAPNYLSFLSFLRFVCFSFYNILFYSGPKRGVKMLLEGERRWGCWLRVVLLVKWDFLVSVLAKTSVSAKRVTAFLADECLGLLELGEFLCWSSVGDKLAVWLLNLGFIWWMYEY